MAQAMTEAELELGRLRARLWRQQRTIEQWERYAERLEREIKRLHEPPGEWWPNPETSSLARWWLAGAD
jgi:hypothetical protein